MYTCSSPSEFSQWLFPAWHLCQLPPSASSDSALNIDVYTNSGKPSLRLLLPPREHRCLCRLTLDTQYGSSDRTGWQRLYALRAAIKSLLLFGSHTVHWPRRMSIRGSACRSGRKSLSAYSVVFLLLVRIHACGETKHPRAWHLGHMRSRPQTNQRISAEEIAIPFSQRSWTSWSNGAWAERQPPSFGRPSHHKHASNALRQHLCTRTAALIGSVSYL